MIPSPVSRFSYALEPIVPIGTAPSAHEVELLCRTPNPDWIAWYCRVPEIVLNAVQNLGTKRVAINLDTEQILHPEIASAIASMKGLPIDIEWTERVSSDALVASAAQQLRDWQQRYQFGISIDDVGSGQDGLSRASATQAHRIKIDGKTFQSWRHSPRMGQMVNGLVTLYRSVGCDVVVEWVETIEDFAQARFMRATHTQGRLWRTQEILGIQ